MTFSLPATRHVTFAHVFFIVVEALLLIVQFYRMEILAFDLLPELADLDFGFFYGSHVMALIWVLLVIVISYVTWEVTIRMRDEGTTASGALKAGLVVLWVFNLGAMALEWLLFEMLVDDLGGNSYLGLTGAPELLGALMVGVHQLASLWIMRDVVGDFFLPKRWQSPIQH